MRMAVACGLEQKEKQSEREESMLYVEVGGLKFCSNCNNERELLELFEIADGHYRCGWCLSEYFD